MSEPDYAATFRRSIQTNLAYWLSRLEEGLDNRAEELEAEWTNLRQAIGYGLRWPVAHELAGLLILHLFGFVETRARWPEWLPLLEQASQAGALSAATTCRVLLQWGQLLRVDGQWARALGVHEQAEAHATRLDQPVLLARVRLNLSEDLRCLQRFTEAERLGLAALGELSEEDRQGRPLLALLSTLGKVALATGQLDLAVDRLRQAVGLARLMAQPILLARALDHLGTAYLAGRLSSEALECYTEAARQIADVGSPFDVANIENAQGSLLFSQHRYAEAEAAFRRADPDRLRQAGYWVLSAQAANNLGHALQARGQWLEASVRLRQSIAIWRQMQDEVELGNSLFALGDVIGAQGQHPQAQVHYEEAISFLERHPESAWAQSLLERVRQRRSGQA